MQLSFHGATREVTGSCHLLETRGLKILVDCGLFQEGRGSSAENARPFRFRPQEIDFLLLTHAHLDHCGRIPLLVRRGFRGEIVSTAPTRDLTRLVLLDAARIQEEDARHATRRARRRGKAPESPLFDTLDVLDAMDRFGRTARYGETLELSRDVRVTFNDAGHILGSATVLVESADEEGPTRVLFSGDLGNLGKPVVRDPPAPPDADIVVMETTYGDRPHRDVASSVEELYGVILETFDRGGNVYIPSFALERAQDLLYFLREGVERGVLPRQTPVFLDSPMAISATRIFGKYPGFYDEAARRLIETGADPFAVPGLRMTREVKDSMAINDVESGAVVIAGSGMCTGGRILHHLKHSAWRRECSLVFVSFAAEGTLARRIIDGARRVNIHGEPIEIAAHVHTINGFSAHAGADELVGWHAGTGTPGTTFLVHGEPSAMDTLARRLREDGHAIETPERDEAFSLARRRA